MSKAVTLVVGDGGGPQTAAVVQTVIAVTGVSIDWDLQNPADPEAVIASIRKNGIALRAKYNAAKPVGKVPYVIHMRKSLGVHTIVRHVHNLAGLPARAQGVDIVIVREASEDIYAGFEHATSEGVFETVKVTTAAACERIARHAFDYARTHGRKKVTTVHKANILKKADGMFLRCSQQVAADYPDIQHDEVIVDALCMKLVRWPQSFDVLLCGNLFGDIVSDCAAGMAGGITVAVGTNIGPNVVVFDNPHGISSAECGEDGANPYPMLHLGYHLLNHIGENAAATRLLNAMETALKAGVHSSDMGGTARCSEIQDAVLKAL